MTCGSEGSSGPLCGRFFAERSRGVAVRSSTRHSSALTLLSAQLGVTLPQPIV
jgi:hypothetical protein